MRELNVAATTHGRVLIDGGADGGPLRLLAGFHGYAQNADEMMAMLRAIPLDGSWTRVSIQGLHRFYRARSQTTVASWMTRQDRDALIADNIGYVDAAIAAVAGGRALDRLAFCGFSQGVAMAFRAGVLGARGADAVAAVGGDVPPELLADPAARAWPRVLLARGADDAFYAPEKMRGDAAALEAAGTRVETFTYTGGHEWTADCAARAARFISGA
jgi:predicted esterase